MDFVYTIFGISMRSLNSICVSKTISWFYHVCLNITGGGGSFSPIDCDKTRRVENISNDVDKFWLHLGLDEFKDHTAWQLKFNFTFIFKAVCQIYKAFGAWVLKAITRTYLIHNSADTSKTLNCTQDTRYMSITACKYYSKLSEGLCQACLQT
jgi:hypothetical protein